LLILLLKLIKDADEPMSENLVTKFTTLRPNLRKEIYLIRAAVDFEKDDQLSSLRRSLDHLCRLNDYGMLEGEVSDVILGTIA
jgi:hypothetical protein